MNNSPIIILGAARSGTKMLRGAFGAHPAIAVVPYDINYVWKYGNYECAHDELSPAQLTEKTSSYIRAFLEKFAKPGKPTLIVEKTVSNTLRVPFVRRVFPACKFVNIVRDGRDVAASARRMWRAPVDFRRLLQKAVRFPLRGLPTYGLQYLNSYLTKTFGKCSRVSTWGPRFKGLDTYAATHTLLETCGYQWVRCVEQADADLQAVPNSDVLHLRYEDFVASPEEGVSQILDFVGLAASREVGRYATETIVGTNVSKWETEVSSDEYTALLSVIGQTLEKHGYAR